MRPFVWLRSSFRRLLQRPGLSVLAVVILALGIAPMVWAWSVLSMEGAFAPRKDPGLVCVGSKAVDRIFWERGGTFPISWALYRELKQGTDCFDLITASPGRAYGSSRVLFQDQRFKAHVTYIDARLLDLAGHHTRIGRRLTPEDLDSGEAEGVMLGSGFWYRQLDHDPHVVGAELDVNGRPVRILGVQGDRMIQRALEFTDLYVPFDPDRMPFEARRPMWVVARLRPGVNLEQARQQVQRLASQLEARYPDLKTSPLEVVLPEHGAPLIVWLAMAAMGLPFFLVSCMAVSGLLLARGLAREPEMAMRSALGASRLSLSLEALGEPLLLGLLATALAWGPTQYLTIRLNQDVSGVERMSSGVYLGVALAVLLVTLMVGLLPSWRAGAVDPARILGRGATTTQGHRIQRWQRILCALQVCLSMGLVGTSALFVQFARRQTAAIPYPQFKHIAAGGFRLDEANQNTESSTSPGEAGALRIRQWLLERPGVKDVSLGWGLAIPVSYPQAPIRAADTGRTVQLSGSMWDEQYPVVTGLAMLSGRWPKAPGECALSRYAARQFWDEGLPLGRVVETQDAQNRIKRYTVVGVVQDAKDASLFGEPGAPIAHMYRAPQWNQYWNDVQFLVRSDGDGSALIPGLERALAERNPERAFDPPVSPQSQLRASPHMALAMGLGAMGGLALLIQSLGVMALIYYLMEQRRRETGIRMALGAAPGRLMREVFIQALKLVGWGLPFGILTILAGGRIARAFMLHLSWIDLPSLCLAAGANVLATLIACLPAMLQIRRVSPVRMLREE